MTITKFVKGWHLAPGFKVKYSLDPNWPDQNLIRNPRNAASALQGLVHIALWKLGRACSIGIRPEKFIVSVSDPTPKMFAYPGTAIGMQIGIELAAVTPYFYYRGGISTYF